MARYWPPQRTAVEVQASRLEETLSAHPAGFGNLVWRFQHPVAVGGFARLLSDPQSVLPLSAGFGPDCREIPTTAVRARSAAAPIVPSLLMGGPNLRLQRSTRRPLAS